MKKLSKVVLVLCMCFALFACTSTEKKDGPIEIVDQAGRTVTLEKPAEKIVSGYYISTSTIIGLGLHDKLVGVEMKADTREIYKQAAPVVLDLPAMGNKKMFNVEECAKTEADVVFLPKSLSSYIEQLEQLGMVVIILEPETTADFDEAVNIIAKVTGSEDRAKAYFDYRDTALKTYLGKEESEDSVYFAGSDALSGAGDDMFQGEILKAAHAKNAMSETGNKTWINIDKETLLKANPAYIFLENGGVSADVFVNDAAYRELDALKNQRIYTFPSSLETWDTPNLSYFLGTLWTYATMHPEALSMEDVSKVAVDFYKEFYGIEVSGETLGL